MRRLVERSLAIALAGCITASVVVAQTASASPAGPESDGHAAWQRLWHPAFSPRIGGGIEMLGVRRLGDTFAITGGDDRGAVVWWSEDGVEWTRSPRSETTDHGYGLSIDGGPGAYVMIGGQWTPWPRARIWHSADGLHWERVDRKLPKDSGVSSVVHLDDGRFVIFGSEGRRGGCWMASSPAAGATWDMRWEGDWDPGIDGACVYSATRDAVGLAGIVAGGISVSQDGASWEQIVSEADINEMLAGASGRVHRVGLVPLDADVFVLGGYGTTTLTWSRGAGLALVEDIVDWSELPRADIAFGPERSVTVKYGMRAPLVSPPTGVHQDRSRGAEPVCRPGRPKIRDIAAMRPRERLECYGARDLTFTAWVPFAEYGGTCPFGAPYDWLVCWETKLASGPGPRAGILGHADAPSARSDNGIKWGSHVRVTGHFDDPAAALCPEPDYSGKPPAGYEGRTKSQFVNECRRQFVVTEMRLIDEGKAPDT